MSGAGARLEAPGNTSPGNVSLRAPASPAQVMVACFEVFQTWDDEYEKLQVLLRDIVKRKREENLKMVWRINPAHRKLQARLDQMRKFRRQHEQLRAVIVRVLRPQVGLPRARSSRVGWLCAFCTANF